MFWLKRVMNSMPPRGLLPVAVLALLFLFPSSALAKAKWTVALVIAADYDDMKKNLEETGSSDDVNVVVLHSVEGKTMSAYRLLKDQRASQHPPGQCCPDNQGPCCGSENIPLQNIAGLVPPVVSASNIDAFYKYVQANHPAEHYMLVNRGHMRLTYVMLQSDLFSGEGLSVSEQSTVLKNFVARQGGQKIDLLVNGFCLTGNADWSYAAAPYVDYYVGSPNFSLTPISIRWRPYRWIRELIENTAETGRSMSSRVVDIFSDTNSFCRTSADYCSRANGGCYWTSSAYRASRAPKFATAMKNFVCTQLDGFDNNARNAITRAMGKTGRYGTHPVHYSERYDLKSLLTNLRTEFASSPTKVAGIDALIAAHDNYVYKYVFEKAGAVRPGGAGYKDGEANGLSVFIQNKYATAAQIGPFQIDSLWKAFLDKYFSGTGLPAPTGLTIETSMTEIGVGQDTSLLARGSSAEYPSMCALPRLSWTVLNPDIASVADDNANPARIVGKKQGSTKVRVTFSGLTTELTINVKAQPVTPPSSGDDETDDGVDGATDITAPTDPDNETDGSATSPLGTGGIDDLPEDDFQAPPGADGKPRRQEQVAGWSCRAGSSPHSTVQISALWMGLLALLRYRTRRASR